MDMEDNTMALYDFKCMDCGEVTEYLVFSESDKLSCKKCGSERLEKLMSSFAVSVKTTSSDSPKASCSYGNYCNGGSCD